MLSRLDLGDLTTYSRARIEAAAKHLERRHGH